MTDQRLPKAILLTPVAAALAPIALLLAASATSMTAEEWIRLPFWLPFFALWTLLIGYPIALLHLALAWPFYRLLRGHLRLRWWIGGGAGGLIGALPVSMLGIFVRTTQPRALAIGASDFGLSLLFGGAGIVGGLVFWWIVSTNEAEVDPA